MDAPVSTVTVHAVCIIIYCLCLIALTFTSICLRLQNIQQAGLRRWLFYSLTAGCMYVLLYAICDMANILNPSRGVAASASTFLYIALHFLLTSFCIVIFIWVQLVHLHHKAAVVEERRSLFLACMFAIWIRVLPCILVGKMMKPPPRLFSQIDGYLLVAEFLLMAVIFLVYGGILIHRLRMSPYQQKNTSLRKVSIALASLGILDGLMVMWMMIAKPVLENADEVAIDSSETLTMLMFFVLVIIVFINIMGSGKITELAIHVYHRYILKQQSTFILSAPAALISIDPHNPNTIGNTPPAPAQLQQKQHPASSPSSSLSKGSGGSSLSFASSGKTSSDVSGTGLSFSASRISSYNSQDDNARLGEREDDDDYVVPIKKEVPDTILIVDIDSPIPTAPRNSVEKDFMPSPSLKHIPASYPRSNSPIAQ
eukprot:TRINITY_DN3052_c0_g1_i3.p1 TRINITY_DN3052_c0_g1~~TRINITY_DN3052_c0_g1_i3.p1  ORF type:complete len:427 (-),score=88.21 TRINITY_DN3052_c0_g1_i3:22-1302(-)